MKSVINKPSTALRQVAAVCSLIAVLVSDFAWAQLEEIVVTATRRETTMQDAPIAVSAFTGDELDRRGVVNTHGIGNIVPNVTIGTEGARDATYIAIRGVSQNERRNVDDATTPFYIDGATIPRMSGVNAYFYDVERMEVLRGPQGTLYGRNSTSGVVNIITNKPNFDGVGGDVEVTVGNYEWAQFKGAMNIPLTDTVSTRFAFLRNTRDGYRNNAPVANGDDADDTALRGHLLWNIGDNTSLLLSADYYHRGGVGAVLASVECPELGCNTPVISPDPADTNPLNTEGFRDNTDTNYKFDLTHSFESFNLDWLGSWRKHERDYLNDNDGMGISVFLPPAGGLVPVDGVVDETTESKSFSSELRLTSTGDGPLQWIVGAYYLDEEINGDFRFQPPLPNGAHLNVQFVDKGLTIESRALFGNLSYSINESFTINGGVRYTEDEKDKGGVNNPANPTEGSHMIVSIRESGNPVAPVFPRAQVANPSWEETTWHLGVDWNVNPDSLAYAKFSTGYKAGGFNRGSVDPDNPSGAGNVANLIIYDPETVDAWEAGWKSTIMDGRGRVNFAGFYYDYKDKVESVVRVIGGIPTNTAINASAATIWGFELETSFLYGDSGGRLDFNLGYLDATYDDFKGLDDPLTAGQDNLDVSGGPMVNAPEWNISATWVPVEWTVWNGSMRPMIQVNYKSDYITRPHNQSQDLQSSFTRSNASLYWESMDTGLYWELFVNNIEDEAVQSWSSCGSAINGVAGTGLPGLYCNKMYQPPRTYGGRIGYRF